MTDGDYMCVCQCVNARCWLLLLHGGRRTKYGVSVDALETLFMRSPFAMLVQRYSVLISVIIHLKQMELNRMSCLHSFLDYLLVFNHLSN